MSFWKTIFGKSKKIKSESQLENEISTEFRNWVKSSIKLIGIEGGDMENEELHNYLIQNGIPEFDAGELIIFLPTAFCRKLLPDIKWLPEYVDYYSKKKQIKKKYNENNRYLIIEEETEKYWNNNPSKKIVLNIAGRSAEFNAINKMLNNGGKLEDVKLTESYVIR